MKFKEVCHELMMTLSDEPSLFSSKRLERFAVFTSMLLATDVWLFRSIWKGTLEAGSLMMVVAGWMVYAGFNVIQAAKK